MGDWISWTDDLTINVEQIDMQHRELIKRFNDLGEAVWDGKGKQAVGELLVFLANYTVEHFRAEEDLMGPDYPGYAAHKKAHAELVAEVAAFIADYETGGVDSPLVISVVNKLGNWTRQHIRGMDKGLAAYVRSRAVLAA